MPEEDKQRTFLVTGSIFLTVFNLFTIVLLAATEMEGEFIGLAAIVFAVSMLLLASNTTLLCATQPGKRILKIGSIVLWMGLILVLCAYVMCIVSNIAERA